MCIYNSKVSNIFIFTHTNRAAERNRDRVGTNQRIPNFKCSRKKCAQECLWRKRVKEREKSHTSKHVWVEKIWHFLVRSMCVSGFCYAFYTFYCSIFFLFCVEASDGYETAQRIVKNKFHFSLLLLSLWLNVSKSLFTFCKCMFIKMPNMRQKHTHSTKRLT